MKAFTIMACAGAVALAAVGVAMATTNPSPAEYEEYAAQQLTEYIKANVCKKTPNLLKNLVNLNCNQLIESANPQMRDIIAASTQRQNFLIFSIYRTDLTLNSLVPSYQFETVGAFDKFYTYNAQQR
ncbi:DUF4359 domain-containing protein [Iningainema tapete]|uniref:DUF4359 domain-containing protein n=1 Tax=Iningainema tapete BLCC-T55 TaxID=2748662 RepID=A0A8J7BZA6_9CYAN|nr:DUF4359 domain-containing protein [Iningainema tapete]MBD2775458.1 DUF4359 domain-containing protein [Iningainema tapete BLCC-T55]